MKSVGLSLMSLGMLGLGVACSDGDAADDTPQGGGAESGGAASGGTASGGGGSGGKGSGGSEATGGVEGSGGGGFGGTSEFNELYEQMEGLCRSAGYVAIQLDLPSTTITGGVGFIARSSDDVVEGDLRHLTLEQFPPGFEVRLTWPASATGGVEVDASGALLSGDEPEYNLCFVGKALVEKELQGEPFHIVASDDVTVANADGTCSDTKVTGTVAFCAPAAL